MNVEYGKLGDFCDCDAVKLISRIIIPVAGLAVGAVGLSIGIKAKSESKKAHSAQSTDHGAILKKQDDLMKGVAFAAMGIPVAVADQQPVLVDAAGLIQQVPNIPAEKKQAMCGQMPNMSAAPIPPMAPPVVEPAPPVPPTPQQANGPVQVVVAPAAATPAPAPEAEKKQDVNEIVAAVLNNPEMMKKIIDAVDPSKAPATTTPEVKADEEKKDAAPKKK
jgi:hypothetical protein